MSPLERLDPFLDELVPKFDLFELFDADEFVQSLVRRLLQDSNGHSVTHSELIHTNLHNWENPLLGALANLFL